ncbi:MAG: hypothetical protein SOW59_03975, partial [Corynebacterium sp.]|nr:hypothetical protein [Corynebacterium sp.]
MSRKHQVLLGLSAAEVRERIQSLSGHQPEIQSTVVVVDPIHVPLVASSLDTSATVAAVAGYPTGRHHTLIKASESRLAFQSGAQEIWVSVDNTVTDSNAHLSDLVAVREACPEPVRLGLILPRQAATASHHAGVEEAFRAAAQAAALAGFDILISPVGPDSQKNT